MRLNGAVLLIFICSLLAACSPVARAAIPTTEPPSPANLPATRPQPPRLPATLTSQPAASATPRLPATPTLDPPPSPTPTQPACQEKQGRFVPGAVNAALLPDLLEYRVYLPPCYDQQPSQRYPVLYLIHGQSFTDDQWQRLGVGDIADRLIISGQARPFIIVMPRDRIWTDPDKDPFDVGLIETLIPYIDSHYRTLADRLHRAVGGMSRGAGWALHLGLTHPEVFGSVGMHSLAIFWADVPYIKNWLDAIPVNEMPRFYLDIGNNDRPEITESARWFEGLLDQRDISHEWHFFTGYHEEKYWQAHAGLYLRWYALPWAK